MVKGLPLIFTVTYFFALAFAARVRAGDVDVDWCVPEAMTLQFAGVWRSDKGLLGLPQLQMQGDVAGTLYNFQNSSTLLFKTVLNATVHGELTEVVILDIWEQGVQSIVRVKKTFANGSSTCFSLVTKGDLPNEMFCARTPLIHLAYDHSVMMGNTKLEVWTETEENNGIDPNPGAKLAIGLQFLEEKVAIPITHRLFTPDHTSVIVNHWAYNVETSVDMSVYSSPSGSECPELPPLHLARGLQRDIKGGCPFASRFT